MSQRQIPWPRLFAEGVIIAISVLLALAADAWWANRSDRVEEAEILAGLRAELTFNREALAGDIATLTEARDLLRALAAPSTPDAADVDVPFSDLLSPIHRGYAARLPDGFRTATISSGKLALIRDPVLRASLVEIEGFEENLVLLEGHLETLSREGAVALARHTEGLNAYRNAQPTLERRVPSGFRQAIQQDRDVMAIVGAKINFWNGYIGELGRLDAHLAALLALIDSAVPEAT